MPSNTIKIPHIAPHRPGVGGVGVSIDKCIIKTESVREKVHLSFAARRFFKSGEIFRKPLSKIDSIPRLENELFSLVHTNKGRFYYIFKFKGIILTLV